MPIALITGASRGLGRALARSLAESGWQLVIDGRDSAALSRVVGELGSHVLAAVTGDVTDPAHQDELGRVVRTQGRLDLLVNNASLLGPMPHLLNFPLEELERVFRANAIAPLAITQQVLPALTTAGKGVVINVSSDAAVQAYSGWGGYGASKAALDQLTAVLAAEQADLRVYAFDPGDMRTDMQQEAFPGEDISDRPEPETVVPSVLHLLARRPPSGRYRHSDLVLVAPERAQAAGARS